LVSLGIIVSLADGDVECFEGTTDGVAVEEGLHATSRRMMVMDIPSFFGYIFYSLLSLRSADHDWGSTPQIYSISYPHRFSFRLGRA
jgi:hypothetical protein